MGPDRGSHRRALSNLSRLAVIVVIGAALGPPPAAAGPSGAAGPRQRPPGMHATRVADDLTADALTADNVAADNVAVEDVAAAQASAREAARRVEALRVRYVRLSAQANAAAERLTAAFAEQANAGGEHQAAVAALARAEATRAASVRAVYAAGGRLGLLGTVLSAPTPDDALWRLGTARRIQAGILLADRRARDAAAATEQSTRQEVERADRADAELARALATFQDDVAAADAVLARARAELDRLSATARRLEAAREAARRLAEAQAAAQAARLASRQVTAMAIPADYRATYRVAAGTCPGLDWTVLAAVGQIESGHGRHQGPSSAGAIGPMQFMPATFAQYAVDGDHDGTTDAWDYRDAIFTAAAYLCASGAREGGPDGIRAALFAYNHAQWYVDLVLAARAAIAARETG